MNRADIITTRKLTLYYNLKINKFSKQFIKGPVVTCREKNLHCES